MALRNAENHHGLRCRLRNLQKIPSGWIAEAGGHHVALVALRDTLIITSMMTSLWNVEVDMYQRIKRDI